MLGMAIRKWCVKLAVGVSMRGILRPVRREVSGGGTSAIIRPIPALFQPHSPRLPPPMNDPHLPSALVWFRRDLRCHDHAALYHALRSAGRVFCVFVFDTEILDALPDRRDRRVEFIHAAVTELDRSLDVLAREAGGVGGGLTVRNGRADELIPPLARELGVAKVFTNRDYEPAAIERDRRVAERLAADGIGYADFKDQVIFERDEVLTQAGQAFSVFTPYKNAWLRKLDN